jgi:hypothetical protein
MPGRPLVSKGSSILTSMVSAKPRHFNPPQHFSSLSPAVCNEDRQFGRRTEYTIHSSLFVHMAHIIKAVPQRRSATAVTSLLVGIPGSCQNMRTRRSSTASNRNRDTLAPWRNCCRRRALNQLLGKMGDDARDVRKVLVI